MPLDGLLATLPVRQGRDDQTVGAAQELVLIDEGHVGDVDGHAVGVLVEVEAALLQPLEVGGALDVQPALGDKTTAPLSAFGVRRVLADYSANSIHFALKWS